MNKYFQLMLLAILTTGLWSCQQNGAATNQTKENNTAADTQRIVSLNGAITEIICALGHGAELVGRDVTSTYPEAITKTVKDLGHVRSISIESVMALNPSLILASDGDITPQLEEKIKSSGIRYKVFHQDYSVEGTRQLITQVASFIGNDAYQPLLDNIDAELAKVAPLPSKPKVLFIYARGAGTLMVAGRDTPMQKLIGLAGGRNAAQNIEGFKPLTAEALVENDPEVILLFNSGLKSLGGINGLLKVPGVSQTTAGKEKAVITMDGGLITNFGPRLGEAAVALNKLLAPYAQ